MKTIYDFEVFTKKKVEKKVEKKKQKKDKESGEIKKWTEEVIEMVEEEVPCQILIKKQTRSLAEEASLFYSIAFNKYVKMGLLTDSQVAQRELDSGQGFSDDQTQEYTRLLKKRDDLQEKIIRIRIKEEKATEEELEKQEQLETDLIVTANELEKYERLKTSAYEHTADSKAKADTLLWWCLFLTYMKNGEEDSPRQMFDGDTYKEKKASMEELEDNEDEVYINSYQKISNIMTIWFYLGQEDAGKISEILDTLDKTKEIVNEG